MIMMMGVWHTNNPKLFSQFRAASHHDLPLLCITLVRCTQGVFADSQNAELMLDGKSTTLCVWLWCLIVIIGTSMFYNLIIVNNFSIIACVARRMRSSKRHTQSSIPINDCTTCIVQDRDRSRSRIISSEYNNNIHVHVGTVLLFRMLANKHQQSLGNERMEAQFQSHWKCHSFDHL